MPSRIVVILGSARSDGDASDLARSLATAGDWELIDLNDYRINHFDYEYGNRSDDYLKLMQHLLETYGTFVFVTPVYWYAMSGVLKVFFDRLTDLLTVEKDLGRQLRGKRMGVVNCSVGNNLGDVFWEPFRKTSAYLGMGYVGNVHTIVGENEEQLLEDFVHHVNRAGAD